MDENALVIRPNPGPQETFLSSKADVALFGGAAGGGKALAINTLIPTPEGWTTMGQLVAGDAVYDADGKKCLVVNAFPILRGRPCYAVTFSDGSEIVCDEEHLWHTMTYAERHSAARKTDEYRATRRASRPSRSKGKRPDLVQRNTHSPTPCKSPPTGEPRTTLRIAQTLMARGTHANHSVSAAGPLEGETANLLLDPYVLGVWLGDGAKSVSEITSADIEIIDEVRRRGHEVGRQPAHKYGWYVRRLVTVLKQLGIAHHKWIPPQYLRASLPQRLDLLRGLMDTDGHVDARGQCEFSVTCRALAEGAFELLNTLGVVCTIRESSAMLNGREVSRRWRIKFTTSLQACLLPRKAERQKRTNLRPTSSNRYITAVTPVASVPVRCIEVDSPSHCYLAGKTMIPTHNSHAMLLQPLLHVSNPNFGAIIFRRTNPQIFNEGALWDASVDLYMKLDAKPRVARAEWIFPSGAKIRFAHMEYEKSKKEWDGSQIAFIGFDELTSFSETMFWYMLSRNRSTCGIRPYMRATCNPDADSWVATLVSWWINQDTGYPIPERSGVIRWFIREDGKLKWFDSKKEAAKHLVKNGTEPEKAIGVPRSFTFIPAKLEDNPILETVNPGYRANLMAMELVERERLLGGNWKIRPVAGLKFPHHAWRKYAAPPHGLRLIRYWDKAGTSAGKGARTAGVLMGSLEAEDAAKRGLPRYWVVHAVAERWSDAEREASIASQAALDQKVYGHVTVGMEQEPGSGGKHSAYVTVTNLSGYDVFAERATTNKSARWTPLAAQQQAGNVAIVCPPEGDPGEWDWAGFINELDALAGDARTAYGDFENLDKGKLKDLADAAAGAFKYLAPGGSGHTIHGSLFTSGDSEDGENTGPLAAHEIAELPDSLRELIDLDDRHGWDD